MSRTRAILLLVILVIASAAYYLFFASTPYVSLERAGFEVFEQQFDGASNRVRVVAMLSPT